MPTSRQRLAWLTAGLPLILLACGQSQSDTPAGSNPYADGASHPWSYTAPVGGVTPLSLTPGENTLSFEPILSARNAWGPVEIDRSNGEQGARDGKTLTLNGRTYAKGFGTHANSELRFSLRGTGATCTRFTVDVGLDDEVGVKGSVVFQVYLDGSKAYDSGTMTGSSATKTVDLNITGKTELRLVVTDAGDGISYDHADWANPRVFCQALATAGSLDPSFDGDGRIELTGLAKFVEVLPQPDGRLLAVTEDRANTGQIRRYLPSGRLDTTFGQQGRVALSADVVAREAAFAPDGKLLIAGIFRSGDAYFVSRHLGDGRLDSSFGRTGVLTLRSDRTSVFFVVQRDGRVVVATAQVDRPDDDSNPGVTRVILTRYTTGGALDPSFGVAGRVVLNGAPTTSGTPLLQQRDGRLVVVYGGASPVLARYSADGQPDLSFGQAGVVPVRFAADERGATVQSMVQQADGKLIVAGRTQNDATTGVAALAFARYTPEGRLDPSFGEGGRLIVPRERLIDNPVELAVQTDGRVLAALQETGALRLTPEGRLDRSFGEGGVRRLNIAGADVQRLALQGDGKVLLTGAVFMTPEVGYVFRLLP